MSMTFLTPPLLYCLCIPPQKEEPAMCSPSPPTPAVIHGAARSSCALERRARPGRTGPVHDAAVAQRREYTHRRHTMQERTINRERRVITSLRAPQPRRQITRDKTGASSFPFPCPRLPGTYKLACCSCASSRPGRAFFVHASLPSRFVSDCRLDDSPA